MKTELILLRGMLLLIALTGLVSGVAVFIPWTTTVRMLKRLNISAVPSSFASPIIEYWIMMMAAVCIVVGALYLLAAWKPHRCKVVLPILGWGLLFIGVTAGYHGFRLGLPPWPFYADLVICGVCGPGIVWCAKHI